MTQGSTKGGAFERRCAKMLSLYLTADETDAELIRSVSSGGWARRKVRQVGDLAPNGEAGLEFRLVYGVECKNRQSWEWRHFWTSDDPPLVQWWRKHRGECEEAGLVPLMIFTRNYEPLYLMYPADLDRGIWPMWDIQLTLHFGMDVAVRIVEWEHFAANIPARDLLLIGKQYLE